MLNPACPEARKQIPPWDTGMELAADEQGRGRRHAGADAGAKVALYPLGNGVGAAVGLEAVEVEAERRDALPEMRVVEVALVGVEGVVHLPEAALERGSLGGVREPARARVLRLDREVAEDAPYREPVEQRSGLRAERALEVRVLDYERALAADVVVRERLRRRRAGPARRR